MQTKFIDTAVELARITQDPKLEQGDKNLRIEKAYKEFEEFIYRNFEEK